MPKTSLRTARLELRPFVEADAAFIVALLNDADWLRFIGDKNVHSIEDGRRYLREGPIAMFAQRGYGLSRVALRATGEPIGMCGLLKREDVEDVEIGFAFLPTGRGQGYAREAAAAMLQWGFEVLALPRIVAITKHDNRASAGVLEAIGMRFERVLKLPPDGREVRLFGTPAA